MKEFIRSNPSLKKLMDYIEENGVSLSLKDTHTIEKRAPINSLELNEDQKNFIKNRAAKTIQHTLRAFQIKKKIAANPYKFYLSMMDDDEKHRKSAHIQFGRHVAEIRSNSIHRIENPYIYNEAKYHRDDDLTGMIFDNLIEEFNVDKKSRETHDYVPISLMENTSIDEIALRYFPQTEPRFSIIKNKNKTIALVAIPHGNSDAFIIKGLLSICGLIATPWEIAINTKNTPYPLVETKKINKALGLPKTKESLLKSTLFSKLKLMTDNPKYATNKLAIGLKQLLHDLPELHENAIQRIAMMLDLTYSFYRNNYPKFAFCLYSVIHEISLSLLEQDQKSLQKDFSRFLEKTKQGLFTTLGLDNTQSMRSTFFASMAMSGTNAYVIALHLANKMNTANKLPPKIKVYGANYYEFEEITKESSEDTPDIFIISAGPIVNEHGITPGIDINQLIKRKVIEAKLDKPITVIIDATTALYKNLRLNPEVQGLITAGKLSLIIHESYQKFGLFHTDQAQCGRVYGLCAQNNYPNQVLEELQTKAQIDFNNHVDMRIGAYISNNCGQILEAIKEQHFANGALLKNILTQGGFLKQKVIMHPEMLPNLDDLYFVTFDPEQSKQLKDSVQMVMEERDSFGHFCSTRTSISEVEEQEEIIQTRISADASDVIDSLIQTSQIYIAQGFKTENLIEILIEHARAADSLSCEEQIISLALISNITTALTIDSLPRKKLPELFASMNCLLEQCFLLKNRQFHSNARTYLFNSQNEIIATYKPQCPLDFVASIHKNYQQIKDEKEGKSNHRLFRVPLEETKPNNEKLNLNLAVESITNHGCPNLG